MLQLYYIKPLYFFSIIVLGTYLPLTVILNM